MLRGLLGGVSLGAVVSAGALSVASLVGPPPLSNQPPLPPLTGTQDVSGAGTEDAGPTLDGLGAGPETAPPVEGLEAPGGEEVPSASGPLDPPETGDVADLPEPPASGTAAALQGGSDPAANPAPGDAPQAPPSDTDPVIGTDVAGQPDAAPAPDLGAAPSGDTAPPAPAAVAGDAPSGQPLALDAPQGEDVALAVPGAAAEPQVGGAPQAPAAPGTDAASGTPQGTAAEPQTAEPPQLTLPAGESAPAADTAAPEAPAAEDPAPEVPEGAIVVDIIDDPAEDTPAEAEDQGGTRFALSSETGSSLPGQQVGSVIDAEDAAETAEAGAEPALLRYGAGVAADGRPLISIVLLDTGAIPNAIEVLNTLPMQVTVAIDPQSATAADSAAAYRAAGIEVAIISPIPPRATAQDVAVAFDAAFAIMPEAALVVDTGGGGLSGVSPTDFAMEIFAERGLGFATVSRGLNAAIRAASEAGVPAGVFSRDLDDEEQDARVIRRFLERAVFQARQGEDVALIARLRPDTVSALILWATASQLDTVQVAPMSTLLLKR